MRKTTAVKSSCVVKKAERDLQSVQAGPLDNDARRDNAGKSATSEATKASNTKQAEIGKEANEQQDNKKENQFRSRRPVPQSKGPTNRREGQQEDVWRRDKNATSKASG